MPSLSSAKSLLTQTGKEVVSDDVPTMSAAIAYYTVFSLPPLLVIIVAVAGAVFSPAQVEDAITSQVGGLIGPDGAAEIHTMIENASDVGTGLGSKIAGIAALLFGATGAFAQLQKALNRAWEVEDTSGGGVLGIVVKRLLSFGMILTIAFLLLVSLAVSAAVSAFGNAAADTIGVGIPSVVMQLIDILISVGVITVLFAVIFKVLPDADIALRDVWVGALVTAVLFTLGKFLIGLYLGTSNPGSAFGAAGSLALILVWIYYSSLILLVGAEFTQVWARQHGYGISPEGGAASAEGSSGDSDVHPYAQERDPAPY